VRPWVPGLGFSVPLLRRGKPGVCLGAQPPNLTRQRKPRFSADEALGGSNTIVSGPGLVIWRECQQVRRLWGHRSGI
ncbi:hypothetical protein LEMLEM_LOCUS27281, partial [Lemmus lemmus]